MSPEKEKLLNLEKTGEFVFHGTGSDLEILEPQQAYNFVDGVQIEDDKPAVFATSAADYAIFMAIINVTNCPEGYHSSVGTSEKSRHPDKLFFRAKSGTLERLNDNASGWVYVFERKFFTLRDQGGVEYVSYSAVKPIERVKVAKKDLPEGIVNFD